MLPVAKLRPPTSKKVGLLEGQGHLRKTTEIRVIADLLARDIGVDGMVEIIAPLCVQAEATHLPGANHAWVVQITLGDEH